MRLRVRDNSGTPSAEAETTLRVVVCAAPVAVAGPDQFVTASVVAFDGGRSFRPDGRITAWDWDFGDGAPRDRRAGGTHLPRSRPLPGHADGR